MFTTTRVAGAIFCLLLAVSGCRQKQGPPAEPLPRPGAHQLAPEKIIQPTLDKSPMDMIYYPVDYPVLKMSDKTTEPPIARVIYSRPEKDGRVIFGKVVKYGEPWRLGANEATEIEFFSDVTIEGKPVKKGRYILYCIPFPDRWTIILNNDLFVWGLKIHSSKDVYSFNITASPIGYSYEAFTMEFVPQERGMLLSMAWDNVKAVLPISL